MLKENKYNMSKVILISGSNRSGNTEWILNRLNEQIEDSELILLKNQDIEYCKGCLACHHIILFFLLLKVEYANVRAASNENISPMIIILFLAPFFILMFI